MKKYWFALPATLLWAALTAAAWFGPASDISETERRPLAQTPSFSLGALLDGDFMADFEDYTVDQFPLRDAFRSVKALFCYNVLGQKDNNGIYIAQGCAAQQAYPLSKPSVNHALERLQYLCERHLTGSKVYMAVVPDKNYYLAQAAGQLAMDYEALFTMVREGLPWAEHIDLTETLTIEDYYRTDTHWRQEALLDTAGALCQALGVTPPKMEDYTAEALERPFYGVYYGQAAVPMAPDTITLLKSDVLDGCAVYDYETGKTGAVYDITKLDSRDLYDVYLSGARALLTIENPAAETDRALIVFRDSFGSSIIPLLVQNYAKITLVDIRYVRIDALDQFLTFTGQDVLLLYSTLVLNSSSAIQ